MNQGSNFLGASFPIADNVKVQMKFRREQQSYYFKKTLIKGRPISDTFSMLHQHAVSFLNFFCNLLSAKTLNLYTRGHLQIALNFLKYVFFLFKPHASTAFLKSTLNPLLYQS